MLHIVNVEEFEGLLLGVPALADRLERREADFAAGVAEWLGRAEQVLASNRMALAGSVAAQRAALSAAGLGVTAAGVTVAGRVTPRKLRDAVAAEALRQVAGEIAAAVREDEARIAEATRLMHQVLAVGRAAGLVGPRPAELRQDEWLRQCWAALRGDANLAAGVVRVEGLVGPHDALVVLDRAVARDAAGPV